MRHSWRVSRVKRVDVHRNIDWRRNIEPDIPATASSLDNLDAETLELVTMMIVDGAQSHLNQTVCKALFHDPGKRRRVGSQVALVSMINIRVRINMKDGQFGLTATYGAHDRMSDGMVTAKANQWVTRLHGALCIFLDEIPRIRSTLELDVAMIYKPACNTEIDARFAPHAIGVAVQFTADKCGRFRRAFLERGVIVVRDS